MRGCPSKEAAEKGAARGRRAQTPSRQAGWPDPRASGTWSSSLCVSGGKDIRPHEACQPGPPAQACRPRLESRRAGRAQQPAPRCPCGLLCRAPGPFSRRPGGRELQPKKAPTATETQRGQNNEQVNKIRMRKLTKSAVDGQGEEGTVWFLGAQHTSWWVTPLGTRAFRPARGSLGVDSRGVCRMPAVCPALHGPGDGAGGQAVLGGPAGRAWRAAPPPRACSGDQRGHARPHGVPCSLCRV